MSSKKKGGSPSKDAPADPVALYTELVKLQNGQDYDKALKVCNKILNIDPKDGKAFHCKMVCLVKLGKFETAIQQMDENENLEVNNERPLNP